ncbi:hypothetical protein IGI04_042721 [Brassica rapa subsp. trilocularis]|uniref:Uncharacterized protein n=1 Tax=Brassica rapa subsp. trilocularis TaxID=1813537 RepID=A0ABQ7KIK3_BRACM|nr:hypothetical protein IGI04_042721 [Brassica rapa subsp. trilocularis]
MTRRLKEAVGNILKISKKQEDCLDQDLIISFHHPLNLICYCFIFEKIEFKSSRVDQVSSFAALFEYFVSLFES